MHREHEQEELDHCAEGIVLVARRDVPNDNGTAWDTLELVRSGPEVWHDLRLCFLDVHGGRVLSGGGFSGGAGETMDATRSSRFTI